ncbi:hypothetical protein OAQ61_04110, partial [Candidatus Marinimicrobia bacterium]|nr:hypothetical protein [Candidatus Neomarinimicrobiota bacterium]
MAFDNDGNIFTINSSNLVIKYDSNFNELWRSDYNSYTGDTTNFQDYNFYQYEESDSYGHSNTIYFINVDDNNELIFGGVSSKRNDVSDYDDGEGTLFRSKRF